MDGSDYWEDPDEPYGGTSVRDSSPPFGELALKKCDRWCAEDLAEAWQAASVEELWQLLALRGVRGRHSTHHWEVAALLRHHHGDGQQGAVETAFLLLTDLRWSTSAARRTVAGVIGTGLLDDTSLDGLAHLCFWPDRPVFQHPASWLESSLGNEIVIDLAEGGRPSREPLRIRVADMAPVRQPRYLAPPVRRWAATRMIVRQLADIEVVMARAGTFRQDRSNHRGIDHAAAIVQGCLDACDALDENQLRRLLEYGRTWPRGQVRIDSLTVMARKLGAGKAVALARMDTDAKVRAWAEKQTARGASPSLF